MADHGIKRGAPKGVGANGPTEPAKLLGRVGVDGDFAEVVRWREEVVEETSEFVEIGAGCWRGMSGGA